MVLAWQDPPEAVKSRIWTAEVLEQLRARPGDWALIRTWTHTAPGLRQIGQPPHDIETKFTYRRGERGGRATQLYARAVVI